MDNSFLSRLESMSLEDLYKTLDISMNNDGLGIAPSPDEGNKERGENRYLAIIQVFKNKICSSEKLKSLYENESHIRRIEIATAIADVISVKINPIAAFTVGFIVSKNLLSEICD